MGTALGIIAPSIILEGNLECTICRSTKHYTPGCKRPIKLKTKSFEYEEEWCEIEVDWSYDCDGSSDTYEVQKGKKGKGKTFKSKGRERVRVHLDQVLPVLSSLSKGDQPIVHL